MRARDIRGECPWRAAVTRPVRERRMASMLIPFIHEGVLKTIFIDTWLRISLLGQPEGGFLLTLIDLIILAILAFAVNGITEWLTTKKVGNLFAGIVVTIIGALLMVAFVKLPFDFKIEDLPIVAALIGSIIVGVFYTLIRARMSKK
jgi:uncharacterized membrane-anchored protein YitT (DUF2179 family)